MRKNKKNIIFFMPFIDCAGYNLFKRKPNLQLIRVGWAVMPLAATWMALSTNLNKLEEEEKGTKKYVYSWVLVGIFLIAYLILVR